MLQLNGNFAGSGTTAWTSLASNVTYNTTSTGTMRSILMSPNIINAYTFHGIEFSGILSNVTNVVRDMYTSATFAPAAASTTAFTALRIHDTVNESSGATGPVHGIDIAQSVTSVANYHALDINPTLTSVTGYHAIDVANGQFYVDNLGDVNASGTVTLAIPLSISSGGIGANNATTGFDNLSPLTTFGDLLGVAGTTGVNVRAGVGTTGYVLTVDPTAPTGWAWHPNTVNTIIYMHQLSSDVLTYHVASVGIGSAAQTTFSVSGVTSSASQTVATFMTPAGYPDLSSLTPTTWELGFFGSENAGATCSVTCGVWVASSTGMLLSNVGTCSAGPLSTTTSEYDVDFTMTGGSISTSNRIAFIFVATNTSGTARTVSMTVDGTQNNTHMHTNLATSGVGTLPVVDTTPIVYNVSDSTKLIQLNAGLLTTGETAILSAQPANYTLAGINLTAQTFTGTNAFTGTVFATDSSPALVFTSEPATVSTLSLIQGGSSLAGGNVNGTWLGINSTNAASSTATTASDFINFQNNGTSGFKVDAGGNITMNNASVSSTNNASTLNVNNGGSLTIGVPQIGLQSGTRPY